jgi:glycosyltransferase involved in cell wall biosynthesis
MLLDRAIRSVMQQSMGDLEMVIVNDGGDPGPIESVVEARRDEARGRVTVVHHEAARGMEAATNAGLRATDSRYVAVHDDDDTWHPRFLELTVAASERIGAMGVVTATEAVYENTDYGDIRLFDRFRFDPMADVARPDAGGAARPLLPPTSLFRLLSGNQFPPCSFIYRREVLDEVGYYDERLPVLGDWDFNIRFLLSHDIHFLDEPLAYYHHRKGHSGEFANSVSSDDNVHDRVREELLNRYLRQDLQREVVGIGVLANLLHDLRRQRADDLVAQRGVAATMDSIDQSLRVLSGYVEQLVERDGGLSGAPDPGATGPAAVSTRPLVDRGWRKLLGSSPKASDPPNGGPPPTEPPA